MVRWRSRSSYQGFCGWSICGPRLNLCWLTLAPSSWRLRFSTILCHACVVYNRLFHRLEQIRRRGHVSLTEHWRSTIFWLLRRDERSGKDNFRYMLRHDFFVIDQLWLDAAQSAKITMSRHGSLYTVPWLIDQIEAAQSAKQLHRDTSLRDWSIAFHDTDFTWLWISNEMLCLEHTFTLVTQAVRD